MFSKILVVCIGNICRSPMVEALFNDQIKKLNLPVTIHSAGIQAVVGKQADPIVHELLSDQNIDCSAHRARQLTSAMLLESDLVWVMEQHQRKEIEKKYPSTCGKVHLLGKWSNFEIPDPYKKPREYFVETYNLVSQGIQDWQKKVWNQTC
jgi:protein-tyrosine phosphatase